MTLPARRPRPTLDIPVGLKPRPENDHQPRELDSRLLAQWYQCYAFPVYRRCKRMLGSAQDAHDAVQEVFLRAHRYGATVLDDQAPLHWLYRVADRHCLDVLERRRKQGPWAQTMALQAQHAERAEQGPWEDARLAFQVLQACSERVRSIALAYFVEGLTQDEIAQSEGLSRKTVREKLSQFKQLGGTLLDATV